MSEQRRIVPCLDGLLQAKVNAFAEMYNAAAGMRILLTSCVAKSLQIRSSVCSIIYFMEI